MQRFSTLALCALLVGTTSWARGDDLPPDALEIVTAFQQQADTIRGRAEQKVARHRRRLLAELQTMQDDYTRAAKLDEAVAIRATIRRLADEEYDAQPDPGTMSAFHDQPETAFYFQVTGSLHGSLYGTDVYTADSTVATAAVHAGVLRPGETGVVKVTMLPGQPSYASSTRHGVTSSSWSAYTASFQVERAELPPPKKRPCEKRCLPTSSARHSDDSPPRRESISPSHGGG